MEVERRGAYLAQASCGFVVMCNTVNQGRYVGGGAACSSRVGHRQQRLSA
jgi:hypothetical protein